MKQCDECPDVYYSKGKCVKHYFKSRRKTTRTLIPKDAVCESEGCTAGPRAKGLCKRHYNYKNGYTKKAGTENKIVGYRAAHLRVEKKYGKASTHQCVSCPDTAREWSLDAGASDLYYDENDRPYSLNVEDYSARCVPCHRDYDGGYSALFLGHQQ